jgi:hypothetical protein
MQYTMVKVPSIYNKYFCIVDHRRPDLAALILSYLAVPGSYIPTFEFPTATTYNPEEHVTEFEEHMISVPRSREFNIRVHNAIKGARGCEYLILAGLSDEQKSYLDFLNEYDVIFIDNESDVSRLLGSLTNKIKKLCVKQNDIFNGLVRALREDCCLEIDSESKDIQLEPLPKEGLIVAERTEFVATIIAAAYSFSIDADFVLIEPPKTSRREIRELIERWKVEKDERYLGDLGALIYESIETINFEAHKFATFFTFGVPYSLILKNIIPFTYVSNQLDPDFFVFNNLLVAHYGSIASGVVVFTQTVNYE